MPASHGVLEGASQAHVHTADGLARKWPATPPAGPLEVPVARVDLLSPSQLSSPNRRSPEAIAREVRQAIDNRRAMREALGRPSESHRELAEALRRRAWGGRAL